MTATPAGEERSGLATRPGAVPVTFTPGYEARATELQRILEAAGRFFADSLQLRTEVELAVLAEEHWAERSRAPYGIPFYQPASATIVLPATRAGPVVDDYLAQGAHYSGASLEKVRASGRSFEEGARTMVDLIGYHELGHHYTRAFGTRPSSRWDGEFLATYSAYAFLRREHPRLAGVWEGIAPLPASVQPRHTSLEDFDQLYFGVGPENYNWYQGIFAAKATEVFSARGLQFLFEVREAFPAGADEPVPAHEVLERLERTHPGFLAWAAALQARR